MSILQQIQEKLKAPKNQVNKFGGYTYRSLEDIQEGLKPLLAKYQYSIVLKDDLELIGDRYYIKATASLYDEKMVMVTYSTAYAREADTQKGMSPSQITGTASSYARKYALNALFAIDDMKDDDSKDTSHSETAVNKQPAKVTPDQVKYIYTMISAKNIDEAKVKKAYKIDSMNDLTYDNALILINQIKAK